MNRMIIKLTDYNGYKILVNSNNIMNKRPYTENDYYDNRISTEIIMSNDSRLYVAETADQILEAIMKR